MENLEQKLNEVSTLIEQEEYIKAQAILKDIISTNPDNIEAYKNLGLCEVNLDNPTDAIKAFGKVIELDNNDALSIFYLANCYNSIGEKQKAIENFSKVIELRADYLDAYKSLAMIYIEFTDTKNAIDTINKALNNPAIEPDYSIYYIIATAYLIEHDYNNAIEHLKKAVELSDKNVSIMNALAICYMNCTKYDEAKEVLDNALEIEKDNSLTNYNLGVLYQAKEDYKKALEYFQNAYRLDPSISMLSSLANCALKAQEYEIAKTLYQNLVITYPNNSQYRLSYIEALEMTQDYKNALDNVLLLLALDEKNVALIKKKGTLLRKLKLYQESLETFTTLINRGKIDVEVYYNMAFNYTEIEDYDNAKEMFKKCIVLEPDNPYAHKDLGVLYLKMNCYEWAVDEMQEAINLEDNVAEFHYSLGVSYMMLSRVEEAKKEFERTYELDGNDPDNLSYLGYIALYERDFDKSFEYLQKALAIAPDNFLAKTNMAKYYFQQQKYDVAKLFLLDIIEKSKDDETMNMLAICFLKTEDYEEASGIFSKLIYKYPKNHIMLTDLAKCEFKTNKIDNALEHLRQALLIYDDYKEALDLLEEINNAKSR